MIEALIMKAKSYLGYCEAKGQDDQFIKYYNDIARTSFNMSVAWCAIFVTYVARQVGVPTSVIPTYASCDLGKEWFQKKKRYEYAKYYKGSYTPKRGDIVFYSSRYTQKDSTHTGYVTDVKGGYLYAIEGNKGDAVSTRRISLSHKYILGYGRVADFIEPTTSVMPENTLLSDVDIIWKTLFGSIGNAFGVAGLMGNLKSESNLKPKNLQNSGNRRLGMTDDEYTEAVDNGSYGDFVHDSIGYGLAQWTYWSRKEKLIKFAKSAQASIGDLEMQLQYLIEELTSSYPTVWLALKEANSVQEASDEVLVNFERPANQSDGVKVARARNGMVYFNTYTNTTMPETSTGNVTKVSKFQTWLNINFEDDIERCFRCGRRLLVVDNEYGRKTQAAATVAYQATCNAKFGSKLVRDGVFGPLSKKYGNKAVVKNKSKGEFVYIVEGLLAALGYYSGAFDGECGPLLVAGIKKYQKSVGLDGDGMCGKNTYEKLFKMR